MESQEDEAKSPAQESCVGLTLKASRLSYPAQFAHSEEFVRLSTLRNT